MRPWKAGSRYAPCGTRPRESRHVRRRQFGVFAATARGQPKANGSLEMFYVGNRRPSKRNSTCFEGPAMADGIAGRLRPTRHPVKPVCPLRARAAEIGSWPRLPRRPRIIGRPNRINHRCLPRARGRKLAPYFLPRGALDRKPKVFPLAPWPVHANIWRVLEKSSGHLPADKQRCFWFRDKKEWPPCSIA
jgi:hypothetical protein